MEESKVSEKLSIRDSSIENSRVCKKKNKLSKCKTVEEDEPALQDAPVEDEPALQDEPVEDEPALQDEPVEDEPALHDAAVEDEPALQDAPVEDEPALQDAPVEDEPALQDAPVEDEPALQDAPVEDEPALQDAAVEDEPALQDAAVEDEPALQDEHVEEDEHSVINQLILNIEKLKKLTHIEDELKYALYFIGLEENHTFLYMSYIKSNEEIMKNCEKLYDFAKLYKPIGISFVMKDCDLLDVDKYVKTFMLMFGEDSVRGGSYSDIYLEDFQLQAIRTELKLSSLDQLNENEKILEH